MTLDGGGILVIDDLRKFSFPASYCRTSKTALELLKGVAAFDKNDLPFFDEVLLDYDLGSDDTTRPVIHYLEELAYEDIYVTHVIQIITSNPAGRHEMHLALDRHYEVLDAWNIGDYLEK